MYPILARYGPFFLYSYTVAMGLGLAAGIGLTAWLEQRDGLARSGWIDGLLAGSLAAIPGGRAAFVWVNYSYFLENRDEVARVWLGGLDYHGALLAGLMFFWAWTAWRRRSFSDDADLMAPGLALMVAFGWLACLLEGCAYGRKSGFGILSTNLPDSFGVYALRYQTQLLGLLLALLAWVLILSLRRRLKQGRLFWLGLLLLSAGRLAVDFLRGDPYPTIGSYRLDAILDASLIAAALIILIIITMNNTHRRRTIGYSNPNNLP